MKIEKPRWAEKLLRLNNSDIGFSKAQDQWLNEWFQEYIEPINKMLGEAVEVYADEAFTNGGSIYLKDYAGQGYKALLINIEPIKKETAEDVLRYFVEGVQAGGKWDSAELYERAKAVLGE